MLKQLMILRFTLKIKFWIKKKLIDLLIPIVIYLALLQDTVDTDLKQITSSTQKLEA